MQTRAWDLRRNAPDICRKTQRRFSSPGLPVEPLKWYKDGNFLIHLVFVENAGCIAASFTWAPGRAKQ